MTSFKIAIPAALMVCALSGTAFAQAVSIGTGPAGVADQPHRRGDRQGGRRRHGAEDPGRAAHVEFRACAAGRPGHARLRRQLDPADQRRGRRHRPVQGPRDQELRHRLAHRAASRRYDRAQGLAPTRRSPTSRASASRWATPRRRRCCSSSMRSWRTAARRSPTSRACRCHQPPRPARRAFLKGQVDGSLSSLGGARLRRAAAKVGGIRILGMSNTPDAVAAHAEGLPQLLSGAAQAR